MLYDLKKAISDIEVRGVDISSYAIENSKEEIKKYLKVADAKELPFEDNSFDVVISVNTIHNLDIDECAIALKEISRVSKKHAFVTVDAFRNEEEKKKNVSMEFNGQNNFSVPDWIKFLKKIIIKAIITGLFLK